MKNFQKPIAAFYTDNLHRSIYATDASVYRIVPYAIAYPRNTDEIIKLINFAKENNLTLVPRTAGTSLGGQCVSDGIIVDLSKYFTKILDFDIEKEIITVQPGVIRDELNDFLYPYGLFFAPNTSTSNRCMIGGMVGNNSSGTTSIQYGVTRDKVVKLKTILSDGSIAIFENVTENEIKQKIQKNNLEGAIYKILYNQLTNKEIQKEIRNEFPKKSIHRRNNGYALDALLETKPFSKNNTLFNISKLLCGSEGTLAITTEITLQLNKLPPKHKVMVAAHFQSVEEALNAVVIAMKYPLYMCEMMDKIILDQTKNNRTQQRNRFFVKGNPEAILFLEIAADTHIKTNKIAEQLIKNLSKEGLGYAYPKLTGKDIDKAIALRAAGLGLLGSIIGDHKSVACIEDTAVALEDLPNYISDFNKLMAPYKQQFVYYAHAGAGELHLRPILNLKKSEDVVLFRKITASVANLVKKYKGSLSGEHGDGIVRGGFLSFMIGKKNYQLLREIKNTFDPKNIFNKGKIVDALPIDKNLRYLPDREEPQIETIYNFTDNLGILRATEKCNGSGDCRKLKGGTMCPSYRASKDEKDTTRARANALREFLTNSTNSNKFNHKELYDVFDLCLSCKACASECPSNVDIATLKAEFLYQYQKENGVPFRSKVFANNASINRLGSIVPKITNFVGNQKIIKKLLGIAQERSLPKLADTTFSRWLTKQKYQPLNSKGKLLLFVDEYTNYYDVQTGKDSFNLLTKLGYEVHTVSHAESGRAYISKGLLEQAKRIANENINIFKDLVSEELPLVGIEPSTILSFKDEYIRLANHKDDAEKVAKHTYTIESFFEREIKNKRISKNDFNNLNLTIHIHGHCHQKSIDGIQASFQMLNIPENFKCVLLETGCCGMAGAFGYEEEHYKLSMKIGENSVFPIVRNIDKNDIIIAAGTSCRHQILDGTKRTSYHPASILLMALKHNK